MSKLIIISIMFIANYAFAGWTEEIKCEVKRTSVRTLETLSSESRADMVLTGEHDREMGSELIYNELIPSHRLKFGKVTWGEADNLYLDTVYLDNFLNGQIVAAMSVDSRLFKNVQNSFLTPDGEYQVTVTCSSDVKK